MANKMLIDATHPEETRVAVVRGNRIEEFDFESANKKPLKGNIYLAKVVRVEPSLQAAFVEYGGNRHGFLAFSEIHPDYYQIPVADRERLLAEHARMSAEEDEEDERPKRTPRNQRNRSRGKIREGEEQVTAEVSEDAQGDASEEAQQESNESEENGSEDSSVENVNTNSDALDEIPDRQIRRMSKSYKIQEVIKKRQVMLIQVVKEERGNKGAALTTYLSLAGRYAVLMPNTARGGGISRKIGSGEDRKRLKAVADELDVPEGMGLIIRTAGAERTKVEIKRDYDYLLRVWDTVRDLTLASSAPALVYEEGSLIKRSLRDLYGKDVDEVIVEGEEAYREAKDFMKMLMPSHAKNVQNYKETIPLFAKHGVESQLEVMFQNQVSLRSGGYLVINQTEALVAIDVNSGRSTKEHNIEDTALKTNLEAADEVARQLRLRDMAGLVVIDFIDMEDNRNDRAVERRLKDALKQDRARIQVGRISPFGLMEMSRQRLRTSVLESTTVQCPHCAGLGYVRSTSSTALLILRAVEAALIKDSRLGLTVRTKTANALYILNQKRASLNDLETRYGISVVIEADDLLPAGVNYAIDRTALAGDALQAVAVAQQQRNAQQIEIAKNRSSGQSLFPDAPEEDEAEEAQEAVPTPTAEGDEEPRRKRRRRRRRGRGRREDGDQQFNADGSVSESEDGEDEDDFVEVEPTDGALFAPKPVVEGEVAAAPAPLLQMSSAQPAFRRPRPPRPQFNEDGEPILPVETAGEGESNDNSRPAENRGRRDQFGRNRFRGERTEAAPQAVEAEVVAEPIAEVVPEVAADEKPAKPARKPRETAAQKKAAAEAALNEATPVVEDLPKVMSFEPSTPAEPELPAGERKKGWWSKKILG